MTAFDRPPVLVVMGVSGSGKSTVARVLHDKLGWDFAEGDELHTAQNVAKMASGHPLDDADRAPWLHRVRERIDAAVAAGQPAVVDAPLGRGHVLLFGIRPMWRAETQGAYAMVLNALAHWDAFDVNRGAGAAAVPACPWARGAAACRATRAPAWR